MEKNILSNGCKIFYDFIENENKLTIVFIHGYGVNRKMWQPQLDFLADKYTVINIDVRGHGKSRPCDTFSIKEATSDLKNILTFEKCEEFILIGLSMGGYIVEEYAFTYGGALGYMITGSIPIFLPCYSKWEKFLVNHSASLMKLYPWTFMKDEMTKACAITSMARKLIRPMFDDIDKGGFINSWNGLTGCLQEEKFQFDAPLLVTCGESDKTGTVKKCMKFWKENYKGCETKIFKYAGHAANLDNPEEFNNTMSGFIQNCSK